MRMGHTATSNNNFINVMYTLKDEKILSQKVANTIFRKLDIIWWRNTFTYKENGSSSCNVSEKVENFNDSWGKAGKQVFKNFYIC